MSEVPLSVPSLDGNELRYLQDCIQAGWVSSVGEYVDRFEREICRFTGARHAVACINGTAALQVALRLAGVGRDDEVLLPTLTFIAPVNAVHYLGAHPVFLDCDEFYNLDVDSLRDFLERETVQADGATRNRATGRRIAAVVPVHVFGNAVALDALVEICHAGAIEIVEDATESLGTLYTAGAFAGRHAGTVGRVGCLSFNGNKIVTTGGGGMILTDDASFAARARYLTTTARDDGLRYLHHEVGYNYRLTNLQAAVGVAQLERLPQYLAAKRRNYEAYRLALAGIPGLSLADEPPYARSNLWMYALQVDAAGYGMDAEALRKRCEARRINVRPVWQLNHLQRPYAHCQKHRIERAVRLHSFTLNIPCSVGLTDEQRARVVDALAP